MVAETVVERPVAEELTVADPSVMEGITSVFEMFQVTSLVTSTTSLLPEKVAFAVKVMASPAVGFRSEDVTVILVTFGQTVIVAVSLAAPSVAVTVVTPGGLSIVDAAVSRPVLAFIVATPVREESQLHFDVTSEVLPSSKVPVAIIWRVAPGTMLRVDGETEIDCSVGFTKKPLQATRVASNKSAVTEDRIWTFWLFLNITETPSEWIFHPPQAA